MLFRSNEGARSPADVLVTVDAGRLWRAEQLGFFQPVKSAVLDARIPASLREPGGLWFGFSLRSRLIAYNKAKVSPKELPDYESLADPKWKGRICMRSSTNVYNLSLMGALISHLGEAKAADWAQAVKANFAREPRGGDTDQLKSVAAGECDVVVKGVIGGVQRGGGLAGSGLIIVNPPWRLDEELDQLMPALAERLGIGAWGQASVTWLLPPI